MPRSHLMIVRLAWNTSHSLKQPTSCMQASLRRSFLITCWIQMQWCVYCFSTTLRMGLPRVLGVPFSTPLLSSPSPAPFGFPVGVCIAFLSISAFGSSLLCHIFSEQPTEIAILSPCWSSFLDFFFSVVFNITQYIFYFIHILLFFPLSFLECGIAGLGPQLN